MQSMTATDWAILDFLSEERKPIRPLLARCPKATTYHRLRVLQAHGLVAKHGMSYALTSAGQRVRAEREAEISECVNDFETPPACIYCRTAVIPIGSKRSSRPASSAPLRPRSELRGGEFSITAGFGFPLTEGPALVRASRFRRRKSISLANLGVPRGPARDFH